MKVVLGPGCDKVWRDSLTSWQHHQLAELFRQGRGLRDGTNHGGDYRWRQAGVKCRISGYQQTQRNARTRGHERILILRRDYGYDIVALRRVQGYGIDPDTGEVTDMPVVWVIAWREYVSSGSTANLPAGPSAEGHAR